MRAYALGKRAVPSNQGWLQTFTQILITQQALFAVHAAAGTPTQTHALPDFLTFGFRAHRHHAAGGFMAGHEWELGHAPFVIDQR